MTLLQCMSHSPLIRFNEPDDAVRRTIDLEISIARKRIATYSPDLVIVFSPDHYNGFFYDNMPPFCVGLGSHAIGDYQSLAGPLSVPQAVAEKLVGHLFEHNFDTSISYDMAVDHGVAQPLEFLLGSLDSVDVIPVFVNSVALPLMPVARIWSFGVAIGRFLATLNARVLLIGSGGLSHDPPIPRLAEASDAARKMIMCGRNLSVDQRAVREKKVIEAGREFAATGGEALGMRALNPEWDQNFLDILTRGDAKEISGLDNAEIERLGGKSAHEIRTWVAAFGALSAFGPYAVGSSFYRAVPEWIAGFALMQAQSST